MERLNYFVFEFRCETIVGKALSADDGYALALACNCVSAELRT